MYRVFLIYKPKKLVVTKETDREIRKNYSSFELLNTYKTKKKLRAKAEELASNYKIAKEDIEYTFYLHIPPPLRPITSRPIEEQLAIRKKISEAKKGFKMSDEWKAKISAANKGRKVVRTPAEKLMYAGFRTKAGYKFKWITNPYTGQNKQLRLGDPLPEDFIYGVKRTT